MASCGIESVVPFENHFWTAQHPAPPCEPLGHSPCPSGSLHPADARLCPLPLCLSLPQLRGMLPDCHRHTDRQTDGQTVARSSSGTCALSALPRVRRDPSWLPLPSTQSIWGLPACTATCPPGEEGPQGPVGSPRVLPWVVGGGWGGWDGSGPAGRLGLWAGGSETQVQEVPEPGARLGGQQGERRRPPELTRLGPPGGLRTAGHRTR